MRPRHALPHDPLREVYSSKPFRFIKFHTLLRSRNSQILSFQSFPHSLPKTPGGGASGTGQTSPLRSFAFRISSFAFRVSCFGAQHQSPFTAFLSPTEDHHEPNETENCFLPLIRKSLRPSHFFGTPMPSPGLEPRLRTLPAPPRRARAIAKR